MTFHPISIPFPHHDINHIVQNYIRRLRFSSDADIVRLTNARIIIIIIII